MSSNDGYLSQAKLREVCLSSSSDLRPIDSQPSDKAMRVDKSNNK